VNDPSLTPETLRRQVQQHLESLRLAGVEWLPEGQPMELVHSTPPVAAAESLFGEDPSEKPAAVGQEELTLEARRIELQLLSEKIKGCTRCPELVSTRTQTVFADGNIPVELCCIGEAPGADEDAQGLPFVGAAGQLLNKILAACGFKREEVYICNIIKCRPPGNRTPKLEEAANCSGFLTRQLELVQPKFICAFGGCAAQNLLGTTASLAKLRGRFHDYHGTPVLCTYHPAYLLPHRNPGMKGEVWKDMKFLMKRMGRTIPEQT